MKLHFQLKHLLLFILALALVLALILDELIKASSHLLGLVIVDLLFHFTVVLLRWARMWTIAVHVHCVVYFRILIQFQNCLICNLFMTFCYDSLKEHIFEVWVLGVALMSIVKWLCLLALLLKFVQELVVVSSNHLLFWLWFCPYWLSPHLILYFDDYQL